MDSSKYTCGICGKNHPSELHKQLLEQEIRQSYGKFLDPIYLPSREDMIKTINETHGDFIRIMKHELGYEILNKEFVAALSSYLVDRMSIYRGLEQGGTVLEVGAGNGRLTHFISAATHEVAPNIKIVGSDPGGDYAGYTVKQIFPVEQSNAKTALETHKPTIVICSWMPNKIDLTEDFRRTASVQEYILIGQEENGDPWKTWGFGDSEHEGLTAPYIVDGFEQVNVPDVTRAQTESEFYSVFTTSFRRKVAK